MKLDTEELSEMYTPAEDENNLTYPRIIEFYNRLSGSVNNSAPAPINYNSDITNAQPANNPQYKRLSEY
jgi:hypothetical protein